MFVTVTCACNLLEVHHSSGNITSLISSGMLMRTPAEWLFLWSVKSSLLHQDTSVSVYERVQVAKKDGIRVSQGKAESVIEKVCVWVSVCLCERRRDVTRGWKADWQRGKAEQVMEMQSDRNASLVHPACPGGRRRERKA